MNKVLDLNTVQRPTLELTLMDEERTTLRVKVPTLDMFKEMQGVASSLGGVEDGDRDSVNLLYEMLAKLLSCNRDRVKITAEELREKYNVDLESALIVFQAYVDFVTSIVHAKN